MLKGNLLFYFEKRGGELLGMIILEGCVIELAEAEAEKYCFNINFHGNRTYILSADDQETLECWMKALTCSGFDYMRLMVEELQRQLEELDKTSPLEVDLGNKSTPTVPPRRQNPFNKTVGGELKNFHDHDRDLDLLFCPTGNETMTRMQQVSEDNHVVLRPAPLPPIKTRKNIPPENLDTVRFDIVRDDNEFLMFEPVKENDDFTFEKIHEDFGRAIILSINERRALKEKTEKPLIVL